VKNRWIDIADISYLTCGKKICSVNMIINVVCYMAPVTKNEWSGSWLNYMYLYTSSFYTEFLNFPGSASYSYSPGTGVIAVLRELDTHLQIPRNLSHLGTNISSFNLLQKTLYYEKRVSPKASMWHIYWTHLTQLRVETQVGWCAEMWVTHFFNVFLILHILFCLFQVPIIIAETSRKTVLCNLLLRK
jgi:hypothetical protein